MFGHLLVPLDGSTLAEAVLPVAEALARCLNASITLLHVLEHNAPARVHGERHLCDPQEAQGYLGGVLERLRAKGFSAQCHVHEVPEGDVARSIVQHAEELANDLVLLSTHGRGGMRDLLVGSIAQQVLTNGTRPVLVVHPGAVPDPFGLGRLAVPLDGTARHEHSLPVAWALARACGASVHLVTAVPTPAELAVEQGAAGRMLPLTTAARLDIEEQEAQRYLREVARTAPGVSVFLHVRRGDPAGELIACFREIRADLAVVATHALKRWDAFWAGSVTPRLLSQWRRPVLLVRATEAPQDGRQM
ncbi:MAG: universal stress protein [Bacillota bacterium]